MRRAHNLRAARNLATSSNKSVNAAKKNEIRGSSWFASSPAATARRTYSSPFANVNASSSTAVAPAHRMVRVVAHLGREIERHRQPGLPRGEQMAEPRVGLLRGPEPGVLAHGPELAAIHRGMDAARERERAGVTQLARGIARPVFRTVDGFGVAHFAATAASAPITRAATATSSRLPITSGVF